MPGLKLSVVARAEREQPAQGWVGHARGRRPLLVFGTLAQRFRGVRESTERLAARAAIQLYDANLRSDGWDTGLLDAAMRTATVAKMNEAEAATIAAVLNLPPEPATYCRRLAATYGLEALRDLRRAGAALLLGDEYAVAAGMTVDVTDTVGAGDAFAAGLGHGLFHGWPADEILSLANRLGALVASRPGAISDRAPSDIGLSGGP